MNATIEAGWKALEKTMLDGVTPAVKGTNAWQAVLMAARQAYYVGSLDTAERLREAFCADSVDLGDRFAEAMRDNFAEVAEEMQNVGHRLGGDSP